MKKSAVGRLIKDLLIIAILGGIIALGMSTSDGLSEGQKVFFWLAFTGLPFGWRWASKIITAVSLYGIGLKAVISVFLGFVAIFVVVIADVIRCLAALLTRKKVCMAN